ncbi:MAG: NHLP bacteriocin system secretion protein, partial [Clostridia bacterium]|nr:NHLP bacteriocin system secretion protein [Clostridia bacterium]
MADIFRKSSIEKLSNPEQLDRAITVSSPMSWLALLGVLVVIVAVVIWSIFGKLPTTVSVSGVITSAKDACA